MTNLIIDLVDGADVATGRSCYTVLAGHRRGGTDRNHSRRALPRSVPANVRNGWQFAERLFIIDLVGDQSRHFG